jgi:Ala-tRNA(Pro) deacylase
MTTPSIEGLLTTLGITAERHEHAAVFTCEEAERAVPKTGAVHTKNLFLRDKRGRRHVLLVTTCEKSVNLRAFADQVDADNLSFASPDRLARHLGVTPGAVTLLGLANDSSNAVELYVDEDVWRAAHIHAHPLVNTATLVLSHEDVETFLGYTGHTPRIVRIGN